MTMKYKVRARITNDTDAGITLFSEGMLKSEAFEMRPTIAAALNLQLSAIDVVNDRGFVVEEGVTHRKRRN